MSPSAGTADSMDVRACARELLAQMQVLLAQVTELLNEGEPGENDRRPHA